MIVTLEETKQYLKLDSSDEDQLLSTMITAAEMYIKNATGRTFNPVGTGEGHALAKLAVWLIVTHWFENRAVVAIGTITKEIEWSLQGIMIQLKYEVVVE